MRLLILLLLLVGTTEARQVKVLAAGEIASSAVALPERFQPRGKSGKMVFEEGKKIVSGRDENRGPKGMCLLPDGKHAALIFQSALAQDGGRKGGTARILVLELSTGQPVAEYGYLFEQPESVFEAKTSQSFKDLSV